MDAPEPLTQALADRLEKFATRPTRAGAEDLRAELSVLVDSLSEAQEQVEQYVESLDGWLDEDADADDRREARDYIEIKAATVAGTIRELIDNAS